MTDSPVCYIVGDNESVLLLLLIPRLSYKTELLQSQLKQKVHFVFVFLEFFYITVQTLLAHWLRASIVYEGTDNRNGVVLRHATRGAFHDFCQRKATKETMTMHVYFLHGLVSLKFALPLPVITKLYFHLCSMR